MDTPQDSLPIWDATALTRAVGNYPAIHKRLLKKYLDTARTTVDAITASVARADWLAVSELSHRLKSASRSVGAMHLGALCEALEREGRAANGEACLALAAPVAQGFDRVDVQIRAHL